MPTITNSDHLCAVEWAATVLGDLSRRAWYGKITFSFEAGRITTARQEQVMKPPNGKG